MTRRAPLVALALATVLGACRAAPEPLVPVVGPAHETAVLAGHWSGEYNSPHTGRTGTIDITVSGTGDSASGVVMMVPAGFDRPVEPWIDPAVTTTQAPAPQAAALAIQLIRVEGNKVTGMMAPYADPQTGERLVTSFEGRLAGDTIAGTFTTRPGPVPGLWMVVRQR